MFKNQTIKEKVGKKLDYIKIRDWKRLSRRQET
jgi:hypothetical protein